MTLGILNPSLISYLTIFVLLLVTILLIYYKIYPWIKEWNERNSWILFPFNSLKIKVILKYRRITTLKKFIKQFLPNKRAWLTYKGFWIPLILLLVIYSIAYQIDFHILFRENFIQNTWISHLTIVSLSFIALIFLMEQYFREKYHEGILREILSKTYIIPLIYYSLISTLIISYFYFNIPESNLSDLSARIIILLFCSTVSGIGFIYYKISKIIYFNPWDEIIKDGIKNAVSKNVREKQKEYIANDIIADNISRDFLLESDHTNYYPLCKPEDLGLNGYINDIDLKKLEKVTRNVKNSFDEDSSEKEKQDTKFALNIGLNQKINLGIPILSVKGGNPKLKDINKENTVLLSNAIHCTEQNPSDSKDIIQRNLNYLNDSSTTAINNLNSSKLENYLQLYKEIIIYLSQVKSSERWNPDLQIILNRIFIDIRSIFSVSGQVGNPELLRKVIYETKAISRVFLQRNNPEFFNRCIRLYLGYYETLTNMKNIESEKIIQKLLVDIKHVRTHLLSKMDKIIDKNGLDRSKTELENLYDVLKDLLWKSIKNEDEDTFRKVWALIGSEFIMLNPESGDRGIYRLEAKIKHLDDSKEKNILENEIKMEKRKKKLINHYKEDIKKIKFTMSALAYKYLQDGRIKLEFFKKIYSNPIKKDFKSLETISNIYFNYIDKDIIKRTLKLESKDIDIFKDVKVSETADNTWIRDFYCYICLSNANIDYIEEENISNVKNPIPRTLEVKNKLDLIKDKFNSLYKKPPFENAFSDINDLEKRKKYLINLHKMSKDEYKRQKNKNIINSSIDKSKVEIFKTQCIEEFNNQFTIDQPLEKINLFKKASKTKNLTKFSKKYLLPKSNFIENSKTPDSELRRLGVDIGKKSARSSHKIILDKIGDSIDQKETDDRENVLEMIMGYYEKHDIPENKAIILLGDFQIKTFIQKDDNFVKEKNSEFLGRFNGILIYYENGIDFDVLALTKTKKSNIEMYYEDENPIELEFEDISKWNREKIIEEAFNGEKPSEKKIKDKRKKLGLRISIKLNINIENNLGVRIEVTE